MKITTTIVWVMCLAAGGALSYTVPIAFAEDDHDEHAEHTGHDDHAEKDEHDDHAGHDEHNDVVQLDAATLAEFGVKLATAGPGTLPRTLRLPGEVIFNADQVAHVAPVLGGITVRINKTVGQIVKRGEVMAVINSRELAAARSTFLASRARLDLAQQTLKRDDRMLRDRVGTERQLLTSQQAVREAEIELNLAEQSLHAIGFTEAQIKAAQSLDDEHFNAYELISPIQGMVIERHLTLGEVAQTSSEEAPFVVANLSSVWVNLTVYQRDLASVKPGSKVTLSFGHGIPDAVGTVTFISPFLDQHTRTATARVVLANPQGHWRPGLFVTGHLQVGMAKANVVVPRGAVLEVEGKTVVFVKDEDGFEPAPVKLGRSNATHVEIIDGLHAGDQYVAVNAFAVKAELNKGSFGHAGHNH